LNQYNPVFRNSEIIFFAFCIYQKKWRQKKIKWTVGKQQQNETFPNRYFGVTASGSSFTTTQPAHQRWFHVESTSASVRSDVVLRLCSGWLCKPDPESYSDVEIRSVSDVEIRLKSDLGSMVCSGWFCKPESESHRDLEIGLKSDLVSTLFSGWLYKSYPKSYSDF
jgi:hypothetical protein